MAKLIKTEKKKSFLSTLITKMSAKRKGAELSVSNEPYPFMTEEMITPLDQQISTKDAIKIYKQHMLAIGFLERSELSDFVTSFKEELKEHEQQLKDETNWAKDTLAETKAASKPEVKKLKKMISKSKDEEKKDFARDLEAVEGEALLASEEFELLAAKLALFKKDKRAFLVNYINSEVHGQDWQEK